MVKSILDEAGIMNAEAGFIKTPDKTHAVYFVDVSTDGPDGVNRIYTHDCTVELYAHIQDPKAEAALEAVMDARGVRWTKQSRYKLQTGMYQTVYEFTYIIKN